MCEYVSYSSINYLKSKRQERIEQVLKKCEYVCAEKYWAVLSIRNILHIELTHLIYINGSMFKIFLYKTNFPPLS